MLNSRAKLAFSYQNRPGGTFHSTNYRYRKNKIQIARYSVRKLSTGCKEPTVRSSKYHIEYYPRVPIKSRKQLIFTHVNGFKGLADWNIAPKEKEEGEKGEPIDT